MFSRSDLGGARLDDGGSAAAVVLPETLRGQNGTVVLIVWGEAPVPGDLVTLAVEVAEAPCSVAEWAVAPRFDNPRATVLVLVLG